MAYELHPVEVVHAGAAERPVGGREAGRLDDVRLAAQAGAEAQDRPGVLGDVGLEEGDAHVVLAVIVSRGGASVTRRCGMKSHPRARQITGAITARRDLPAPDRALSPARREKP